MRSVGLGLAFLATAQFVVTPAFAAGTAKSNVKTTSAQVDSTPAPAPAVKVVVAPPATPPGMVTVHINSPKVVSLEKRSAAGSAWEHVCNSPCDVATPTADEYQVLGEELNPSKPFILDASQGDKVTLDITPGYHNKGARGGWILAAGAVVVVGGVITILAGSKSGFVPGDNGTVTNNTNTDFISVGSAVILAGVIVAITGASFMYDNAHTRVDGAIGDVPDKKTDVKAQVQVTAERTPQWHEDTGPQLAASRFVSIFNAKF